MMHLDALFFGSDAQLRDVDDVEAAGSDVVPADGRKVAVPLPNGTEMIGRRAAILAAAPVSSWTRSTSSRAP